VGQEIGNGVRLRPATPDDDAALFALFSAVRAEELAMDGWDDALRNTVLRQQFDAQRLGHRAQHPNATSYLILLADRPIGSVVLDRSGTTWHCVDIAIASEFRRRGIAAHILRGVQQDAAAAECAIGLMVLHSNAAARALYDVLGFRPSGRTETHCFMEWHA
jgi:ribosomal protein S18 acetylase RimI-like enzyme